MGRILLCVGVDAAHSLAAVILPSQAPSHEQDVLKKEGWVMRVMELMKRRCRRVLERAAALTVTEKTVTIFIVFYKVLQTFFSAASANVGNVFCCCLICITHVSRCFTQSAWKRLWASNPPREPRSTGIGGPPRQGRQGHLDHGAGGHRAGRGNESGESRVSCGGNLICLTR